jgi:hypothetical protein
VYKAACRVLCSSGSSSSTSRFDAAHALQRVCVGTKSFTLKQHEMQQRSYFTLFVTLVSGDCFGVCCSMIALHAHSSSG